jgi:hypothetical protein
MNAEEVVINALEPNPEDKEICQMYLDSDKVNNIDVTHVLNTEHRDAIKSLIDKYKL